MATELTHPRELPADILDWLPRQGSWSEEEYLWLSEKTNRLVEFTDGYIVELPVPTQKHQDILAFLFFAFRLLMQQLGGKAYFAPLRLRIGPRRFREPDILLVLQADDRRRGEKFWTGADLVVEVVSPDKPERDLVEKRADYAEGGIPEYWIVDPTAETITVLRLEGEAYVEHGVFGRGAQASSALLPAFSVSVDATLDAE
jgi:Uma2 family endonuclease